MARKLGLSGVLVMTLASLVTFLGAAGSGALAAVHQPLITIPAVAETDPPAPDAASADLADGDAHPAIDRRSLARLVAAQPTGELPRELECLAAAIYFEAKSESLAGQLAVGRVIVNRARSGHFPASYCGVVFQRSQFSFIRGKAMPAIARQSHSWRTASAIAQIAHNGSWASAAEGALYFHARRVSPNWKLTRVAQVDSHIFFR
ncbi:MAG TPA: cell wall hydrolase [Novosphingobium sp.]